MKYEVTQFLIYITYIQKKQKHGIVIALRGMFHPQNMAHQATAESKKHLRSPDGVEAMRKHQKPRRMGWELWWSPMTHPWDERYIDLYIYRKKSTKCR